jgi:hypothetical protein
MFRELDVGQSALLTDIAMCINYYRLSRGANSPLDSSRLVLIQRHQLTRVDWSRCQQKKSGIKHNSQDERCRIGKDDRSKPIALTDRRQRATAIANPWAAIRSRPPSRSRFTGALSI